MAPCPPSRTFHSSNWIGFPGGGVVSRSGDLRMNGRTPATTPRTGTGLASTSRVPMACSPSSCQHPGGLPQWTRNLIVHYSMLLLRTCIGCWRDLFVLTLSLVLPGWNLILLQMLVRSSGLQGSGRSSPQPKLTIKTSHFITTFVSFGH